VWGVGGSLGYSCELRDLFLVFVVCNVHCFDGYLCCICVCSCVFDSSTSQLQGFLSSVVSVRCQIVSIAYRIGVQLLVCMLRAGIGSFFSLSCFLLWVFRSTWNYFFWVKDALHFPLRKNALIFWAQEWKDRASSSRKSLDEETQQIPSIEAVFCKKAYIHSSPFCCLLGLY
jgi:hypothetical protein